ncbi:putative zinc/iron permease [Lupinus albus]|uniref:Putative zinc/iron permease n=1 Tax=Lupinus albus TaxID=3870 RepID=A0A6A4NCI0_LUPAL|nr:putative zinc/iron permease [Lupinus albus]
MMSGLNKNCKVLLCLWILIFLVLLPSVAVGECTCDEEEESKNKGEALKYKIAALVSILISSVIGVCIPFLGKVIPALSPEKNIFFMIKAFAAGVILATGFIHILPDAFNDLTSPCLKSNPWADFPFTGFVAMCTSMFTLMLDAYATSYFQNSQNNKTGHEVINRDVENSNGHVDPHTHGAHAHAHTHAAVSYESTDILRHRVISQVLELGIVVHSVIIGISLGASDNPDTIKPLVAALSFHQFFEGMGLGSCITQAKLKLRTITTMALFFALTTPVGIAIGIGIGTSYNENSPTSLIVGGVFNAASAGILIYMALVDILAADFLNPRMLQNGRLQFGANLSLLIGAGCMSLLAKWA